MATAEAPVSWRINFADSEESKLTPVADFHTTQTGSASKTYPNNIDANALPLMPATSIWVNENAKIVLTAMSDAAVVVESEDCGGMIPIILKNKSTGKITHLKLRVGDVGRADFAGFYTTIDVTLVTTSYRKLGAYTVPAGHMLTLDAGKPVHLYLGDDT